jgi:hypothetical protein
MATRTDQPMATGWGTPTLIRWGAVFGGVVLGFSLLVLLTMLWLALASGPDSTSTIARNLRWFLAGSAIAAMFVGGLVAGWLSGVPRASAGFFNGLTVWGLILIAALAVGVPGVLQTAGFDPNAVSAAQAQAQATGLLAANADALWASLLALLVGAVSAGVGGAIGGAITRPAYVTEEAPVTRVVHEDAPRREVRREVREDRDHADTIVLPEDARAGSRADGDGRA